jgi:hypothetical protein
MEKKLYSFFREESLPLVALEHRARSQVYGL